jgi:hypothetical protein
MHETANGKRTLAPARHRCLTENSLFTQPTVKLASHNFHMPSGSLAPISKAAYNNEQKIPHNYEIRPRKLQFQSWTRATAAFASDFIIKERESMLQSSDSVK